MSTVYVSNKAGHPVAGIILGVLGIAVALLMTLLFGVIAGAAAGILGFTATLIGLRARRHSSCGIGAIVSGVLALVLAFSMTFASVNMMNTLRETAAVSGVAPTFVKYMDNPYLGLTPVIANAVNANNDPEAADTIQNELDALTKYMANTEKPATEAAHTAG